MTYPLFVHIYIDLVTRGYVDEAERFMLAHHSEHMLLHKTEMEQLRAVRLPEHVTRSEIVEVFRHGKYRLQLCSYSYELLMSYLQERKFIGLISIINQHMKIDVLSGKPRKHREPEGLLGSADPVVEAVNKKSVLWGAMPLLEEEEEDDEEEEETGDAGADEARRKNRPKKKPRTLGPEVPPRNRVPLPLPKGKDYELRVRALEQMQKQVALSSTALPSACLYTLFNAHGSCNCLTFSDDISMMAGGFADSFIRVWDLKGEGLRGLKRMDAVDTEGKTWEDVLDEPVKSKSLYGHSGPVYAVRFSPDNLFLLSCSEDTTVRLWSLLTFSCVVCYKGHNYPVWDCAFSPFGHYFVTASHDRTARVWTTEAVQPVRILAGHLSDVDCAVFHPNGNYIATGSGDRSARLWDVSTGDCVRILQGHAAAICAAAFSPDGRLLASGAEDGVVMLWDLASSHRLKALHSHTETVYSLTFCYGSTLLASGGLDNKVCVWDALAASRERPEVTAADDDDEEKERPADSPELLKAFHTKLTPLFALHFTRANLLLGAGVFTGTGATDS